MVAYNFKPSFAPRIIDRTKQQTVRHAGKKRHARPGELVQLYTGLRTRAAQKIIDDPMCVAVDHIIIPVDASFHHRVGTIEINGAPLELEAAAAFAIADGFPDLMHFGRFWLLTHGEGRFEGVVVRWRDQ